MDEKVKPDYYKNYLEKVEELEKKTKPDYYIYGCSLECIDAMVLAYGAQTAYYFCLGSMFKYLWRYKQKNGIEDVFKAQEYLEMIRKLDDVYNIFVEDDVLDGFDKQIEHILKKEESNGKQCD